MEDFIFRLVYLHWRQTQRQRLFFLQLLPIIDKVPKLLEYFGPPREKLYVVARALQGCWGGNHCFISTGR
jgi:hypothetical protein